MVGTTIVGPNESSINAESTAVFHFSGGLCLPFIFLYPHWAKRGTTLIGLKVMAEKLHSEDT